MLQRVIRAVQQLRGSCPTQQVEGATVAMCSNGGAGALFTDVMLLGSEPAMSLLGPQPAGIPLPAPDPGLAAVLGRLPRGELLFQRCERCGTANFLPTAACRSCLSGELAVGAQRRPGDGLLAGRSCTGRRRRRSQVPYAVAIIDIDEGYQMMSNLIGLAPEDVAVGLRVEVDFREITPEITLPYFKPASGLSPPPLTCAWRGR